MKYKSIFFLILIVLCFNASYAQYAPFFQNYTLTEFNAGNQNWDISFADNGKLYVANDKGLLEFDGLKWNFYQLPNKTIIRSVMAYNNVIYTGSYEEFGYWKKNKKGVLVYTSLSNFQEQEKSLDEEFWQILHHNGAILFRSFANLYIYKDGKISKVRPESTIISCSVVNNKVYVSTLKDGIYMLRDDVLIPFINGDALYDTKIVSISSFKNKLLITTALKGCYLYNNNTLKAWKPQINTIIKEQQLNSFLELDNGNMVFGTIKNGVYITNNLGNVLFHISKENGLLNNTVLNLGLGKNNKLWVGLDNGIALVDLNYNHVLYNDNSGELGAVYDVIKYKKVLYIASNTGLFYLEEGNDRLKFVENSQGQVWNLKEINGELFCGHNDGTFLVQDKKLKKISNATGGWVLKKVPEANNTYIQGTYAGLVRYKYENGEWQAVHLGGTTIPIKYLVFEDAFTAWAAHAYKGLYRIKFDETYDSVDVENYKNKGLWSDYNVRVYNIKNDICFKTNQGWQKYEALIDSIVPNTLLNDTFGQDTNIISEPYLDLLVTKNKTDRISFVSLENGNTNLELPNKIFKDRLVVGGESISQINDSIYALNLYDGFMLINKAENVRQATLPQEPILEHIEVDKSLFDINPADAYEFPFNQKISISVSSPNSSNHFFEYAISNSDSLNWYQMDSERLELSNLSNGDYSVHFRATNLSGDVSSVKTLKLKVLPPWYKNSLFFLFTGLLISLLAYGLHKRKINKEQNALHEKLKIEQETLLKEKAIENDKKIVQLKNESLKNEVKLKSKQLANTAMSLVKKNESLLEIKNEISKNKIGFENSLAYKRLLRKIDNSIGHKDEWQLFEYNFNQVHEEFFNELKSKYPQLTHKDLKICAYIKMNLLTKEIAPLMNVSIRGLETHRYRLKRKLNLENDKSLADYLRNFQ
ncbi:helix-turn-helix and ligand-binding sensor domain-containing protein [Hwangdonia lutea]|uniref:Transcriptional regulator n=1 Tax=Hwangdonia lutea TaxID=3075823 RepID=A0AA97HRU4_9FLAO|nr:transcriptional regulator [Hwangdonia sp. SCSIO 19198]WOD45181.1 transcriptional regulator [Hwangdonia sp. SCSIO 19198]